jgi:hypothetical protein
MRRRVATAERFASHSVMSNHHRESTLLPNVRPTGVKHQPARLEDIGAEATKYLNLPKAEHTKLAYRADLTAWCEEYGHCPLPATPDAVAYSLADRSQALKASTLERRLATIAEAHRAAGKESPTKAAQVPLVWAGICWEKGTAQPHKKPTLTKHIRVMLEHLPASLLGVGDPGYGHQAPFGYGDRPGFSLGANRSGLSFGFSLFR